MLLIDHVPKTLVPNQETGGALFGAIQRSLIDLQNVLVCLDESFLQNLFCRRKFANLHVETFFQLLQKHFPSIREFKSIPIRSGFR